MGVASSIRNMTPWIILTEVFPGRVDQQLSFMVAELYDLLVYSK